MTDITYNCVLNALRGVHCTVSGNYLEIRSGLDYKEGCEYTISQAILWQYKAMSSQKDHIGTDELPRVACSN